jgi:hypothetical protein
VIGGKLVFNLLPVPETKFERYGLARRESAGGYFLSATTRTVFVQAPSHWLTVRVDLDRSNCQYFLQQQSM